MKKKNRRIKKITRKAIKCRTFSTFSDPDYPFDDPSDIKAIQETLRINGRKPGRSGRSSSFTPLKEHIILKAVKLGLPLERAASLAGVSLDAIYRWKQRGISGEKGANDNETRRYKGFPEKLKLASIHGELEKLKLVNEAAEGGMPIKEVKTRVRVDPKTHKEVVMSTEIKMKTMAPSWQAAMTLLERRYPERWGKVVQVDPENVVEVANKIKTEVDRVFSSVSSKK